jgi:hypothetical protein
MNSVRLFVMHLLMIFMPPARCFALKRMLLRGAGVQFGANARIVSITREEDT